MNTTTLTNRASPCASHATTSPNIAVVVPNIGPALTRLAEAIQTAKRAGMTCAEVSTHMAIMWPAVPVEDRDDGAI